jgi:hypothetical protein
LKIYSPTGNIGEPQKSLASPASVLNGKAIGILDNTKPNANILLQRLALRLHERTGVNIGITETKNAALAAPDQVLGRLTKEVQIALTGSAD